MPVKYVEKLDQPPSQSKLAPSVPLVPSVPDAPVPPLVPLVPLAPLVPLVPLVPLAPLVPPPPITYDAVKAYDAVIAAGNVEEPVSVPFASVSSTKLLPLIYISSHAAPSDDL